MAKTKNEAGNTGKSGLGWSSPVRPSLPSSSADRSAPNEPPYSLLISLLVVGLLFFIAVPVLGFMYMDMWNATNAAIVETRKMRELRQQLLIERVKD